MFFAAAMRGVRWPEILEDSAKIHALDDELFAVTTLSNRDINNDASWRGRGGGGQTSAGHNRA